MRWIIILCFCLASCADREEYKLNIIEIKYDIGNTDTLRVIAPDESRFYLKPYRDSKSLNCDKLPNPLTYYVSEFKLLND